MGIYEELEQLNLACLSEYLKHISDSSKPNSFVLLTQLNNIKK